MPQDVTASGKVNPDPWEEAYMRFETPEQEIQKFLQRLQKLGVDRWQKDLQVVELFCGRGNGLKALDRLGFTRLEGIDLSPTLARQYQGRGVVHVGDCRQLPFESGSKDAMIVQGGLHHLPALPEDLDKTLSEVQRVLREGGRLVVVEPWLTPFLGLVHFCCHRRFFRKLWYKLDAMYIMIEHERKTYENWLGRPGMILELLRKYFDPEQCQIGWGKVMFVGRKK